MIRELKLTTINGSIYLFPVPVVKERKYLVLCPTEEQGLKIAQATLAGALTHPDLVSDDFLFLTYHTDKRTKIFTLNPKIQL